MEETVFRGSLGDRAHEGGRWPPPMPSRATGPYITTALSEIVVEGSMRPMVQHHVNDNEGVIWPDVSFTGQQQ